MENENREVSEKSKEKQCFLSISIKPEVKQQMMHDAAALDLTVSAFVRGLYRAYCQASAEKAKGSDDAK